MINNTTINLNLKLKLLFFGFLSFTVCNTGYAIEFYFVDDYATPQLAIDAAENAGGGLVRFPCGDVNLVNPLVVNQKGVTLEGCGPGGTILKAGFSTGDIIKLGNVASPFSPCGGVRDLSINSSVTRTSGYAISVAGCEQGIIENLRIQTQGGNGLRFGDNNNSLASIFFVRGIDIEINGSFNAIQIDGSNDRYFNNMWIRGNDVSGSHGIKISESGGDWFSDIELVRFQVGISVDPPSGKFVGWLNFKNVLADNNTLYGFEYKGKGGISGISCVRCWSSSNGSNTVSGRGFRILNGNGLSFTDSRAINNGGHGFQVDSKPQDLAISGGLFTGNCVASLCSNGLAHGIVLSGTKGFRISGVRSGKFAGTNVNRQGYGIFINTGCDNYIVTGNDTRLNITGGISNIPGTSASRIVNSNL